MSNDANHHDHQPGLWDEAGAGPELQGRRRRRQATSTRPLGEATQPARPSTTPPLTPPLPQPKTPEEFQGLWEIEQVSTYLGVPKQTIYAWRQTGKGPKGFRVGKHLRWHARTVIEWTLRQEREQ